MENGRSGYWLGFELKFKVWFQTEKSIVLLDY